MAMKYKALAVDLDGTLLHSDERLTPRSIAALKAAEATGLRVIIATARLEQLSPPVSPATKCKLSRPYDGSFTRATVFDHLHERIDRVCGELLILTQSAAVAQCCESVTDK
jgi:phosphoglycolate phosphatase-like HAD superfamily hydrolase